MKAIIIEDEKLSAEHLCNLLKRIDDTIEIIATFDSVKKRTMCFQAFTLFAKDFNLLKVIFALDTIKIVFKRQS